MAERVVSIKLVADASGVVRGFAAARDAASETGKKIADSARNNREQWATVGTGLTAVGVAITGIGIAAAKTGIEYNTLQQTTRAALTSLLGSASAANAQMEKLDAFARNSPFAKQTFIQAQQQMLAFGIETKKVIPYLDAVQNAVAAAGGSNADIAGIVATMSKIQSSAKITATDLMEFGNRGVNAADLIGSQMGKTGAQIRTDITAGALSATDALDALAAGMATRFDGAAANVKNTFAGAMDRVKAAWRDFSAELAKPLVDPNGGGALVDLLNWTADAMRNFEKLPEPIKNVTSGLAGLVGVGSLLGGTFMLALPKMLEFSAALTTLGVTRGVVMGGLKDMWQFLTSPWGIGLIAAATALHVFNQAMNESKTSSEEMEMGIKRGTGALNAMRVSAQQNERGITKLFVDIESQVKEIGPLLDKAATSGRGFFSSLSFNEQGMLENLKQFGAELSSIAAEDMPRAIREFSRFGKEAQLTRAQMATALGEMPAFKSALVDYAESAGLATDDTTLLKIAMGEVAPASSRSASALEEIQGAADATSDAISGLADEIENFGKQQISSERALVKFEGELAALNELAAEGAMSLDLNTKAGQDNRLALLDVADATSKAAAEAQRAGESQEHVNAILGRGREALINAATAYFGSRDAAAAYIDKILATPETVATRASLIGAEEVERRLSELARTRYATINVRANMPDLNGAASGGGRPGFASGGTISGYAQGGTILKAATGMTIPGIGGGVSDGTVWGRGTAKSDSVLVRLSKGEEVIQEPYASMNRGVLKSINRGDFHPGMMQPQIVAVTPQTTPAQFAAGDRLVLEVEGTPLTAVVKRVLGSSTGSVSSRALTARLGSR